MGLLTTEEAEDIAVDTTSAQADAARAKAEEMRRKAAEAMQRQAKPEIEDAVIVDETTGEVKMDI